MSRGGGGGSVKLQAIADVWGDLFGDVWFRLAVIGSLRPITRLRCHHVTSSAFISRLSAALPIDLGVWTNKTQLSREIRYPTNYDVWQLNVRGHRWPQRASSQKPFSYLLASASQRCQGYSWVMASQQFCVTMMYGVQEVSMPNSKGKQGWCSGVCNAIIASFSVV